MIQKQHFSGKCEGHTEFTHAFYLTQHELSPSQKLRFSFYTFLYRMYVNKHCTVL